MATEVLGRQAELPDSLVEGAKLLAWLLVLNLGDALFTLFYLQAGFAEEANPFMRVAYERSPWVFLTVKLSLVQVGALFLCSQAAIPVARWALRAGVSVYACIVAYHLAFAAWLTCRPGVFDLVQAIA